MMQLFNSVQAVLIAATFGIGGCKHGLASAFLESHKPSCPGYGYEGRIDRLYDRELGPRLRGQHYLDYTGSGVYLNSQVAAVAAELQSEVFGNPHSINPSSRRSTELVEAMRSRLLDFFGADPAQYTLIFTRSATDSLKALGEAFPWGRPASRFAYLVSNHNSVLGIRHYAKAGGSGVQAWDEQEVERWLAGGDGAAAAAGGGGGRGSGAAGGGKGGGGGGTAGGPLPDEACRQAEAEAGVAAGTGGGSGGPGGSSTDEVSYSLFAYPAQDNFAGVRYPLSWVQAAQARSCGRHKWKVLLDAAAYVPTHPLNLTDTPADFVVMSFYKMFGIPSGVGAWIVRTEDFGFLRQLYWAGGSVFPSTSRLQWEMHVAPPHGYEHGTLPFVDIISLRHGLSAFESVGGMPAIEFHVQCITEHLYLRLSALRHSNGAPLLRIFGKHGQPNSRAHQGGVINFELLGPGGETLSASEAAAELAAAGLHLRDGCMCNPGACFKSTGVTDEEVRELAISKAGNFSDWEWVWVSRDASEAGSSSTATPGLQQVKVKRALGSLRASLGWMSRYEDADALVRFLQQRYIDRVERYIDNAIPGSATRLQLLELDGSGDPLGRHHRQDSWEAARLLLIGGCCCQVVLGAYWVGMRMLEGRQRRRGKHSPLQRSF